MKILEKLCIKCNISKSLSSFHSDTSRKDNKHPYCRECNNKYWKSKPKDEKYKRIRDKANRKFVCSRRGLTVIQYETILKNQNSSCAICGQKEKKDKNLAIDHCHKTNIVRGLLCMKCNTGLGKFKDIASLKKALNYLEIADARGCLSKPQ